MKESVLEYIICPHCKRDALYRGIDAFGGPDIMQGTIVCGNCGSAYGIEKGIIHLYDQLSAEAQMERQAIKDEISSMKEELAFRDEEWQLRFPDNDKLGIDDRTDRMIRLISENALLALEENVHPGSLKILEIGAANCWLASRLARDNYCIALDIFTERPQGLEAGDIYIRKGGVYFERICADMSDLPFKESVFDLVVISSSLHHASDLPAALKGINRVLKPKGSLILLGEPTRGIFGSAERGMVEKDCELGINETRYTIDEWKKAFRQAGFSVKISLPANFVQVLRSRGKGPKAIAGVLDKMPTFFRKAFLYSVTPVIFKVFDGFYNAVLLKSSQSK